MGNIRVRIVEYSPGYLADHWCSRGHVLLVLEGELVTELDDGRKFVLTAGTSVCAVLGLVLLINPKGKHIIKLES
jgi:quercetin dioxygenase-like cupin family protein